MSFPKLPAMVANMRRAYAPDKSLAVHQPADPPTDPPEPTAPDQPVHAAEGKAEQEIRLALAPLRDAMDHMTGVATVMAKVMENVKHIYDAPIYDNALIAASNHPYIIRGLNRNHVAVFVTAAQTISLMIPTLGAGIPYTLAAGWNQLDFPPETQITTAGVGFNALFLYSMDRVANA